jgi:hypothetical protein
LLLLVPLLLVMLGSLALMLSALLVVLHLQLLLFGYAAAAVHALLDWLPAG